jgi:hypothetical protein
MIVYNYFTWYTKVGEYQSNSKFMGSALYRRRLPLFEFTLHCNNPSLYRQSGREGSCQSRRVH